MPVCEKLSSLTYSSYCCSTQLEVFSALRPMSSIFVRDLPKGQRNLFAEMASGGTAGGHGELSGRSSDKTNWAKSSYIIHPTCSKGSIWSYGEVLNSRFLSVCYFFWAGLMQPEGCCSFGEASGGQWKHRGRRHGCRKGIFTKSQPLFLALMATGRKTSARHESC